MPESAVQLDWNEYIEAVKMGKLLCKDPEIRQLLELTYGMPLSTEVGLIVGILMEYRKFKKGAARNENEPSDKSSFPQ